MKRNRLILSLLPVATACLLTVCVVATFMGASLVEAQTPIDGSAYYGGSSAHDSFEDDLIDELLEFSSPPSSSSALSDWLTYLSPSSDSSCLLGCKQDLERDQKACWATQAAVDKECIDVKPDDTAQMLKCLDRYNRSYKCTMDAANKHDKCCSDCYR